MARLSSPSNLRSCLVWAAGTLLFEVPVRAVGLLLFLCFSFAVLAGNAVNPPAVQQSSAQSLQDTAPKQSVDNVAAGIERRYAALKNYSASFTQSYLPKNSPIGVEYKGTVHFKRPGKMRWDYEAPEKKQLISDGAKLWLVKPLEKQAIVSDFDKQTLSQASGISFLWGEAKLKEIFAMELVQSNDPKHLKLVLTSKQSQPYYARIIFLLNPKDFTVEEVAVHELSGAMNTLTFRDVAEKKSLNDQFFTYAPSKDVKITQGMGPIEQ